MAFNAAQDDFQALDKLPNLDKGKPVIFACNGAECWKSYKAAKVAAAKGFKSVYWLRGGLPEVGCGRTAHRRRLTTTDDSPHCGLLRRVVTLTPVFTVDESPLPYNP